MSSMSVTSPTTMQLMNISYVEFQFSMQHQTQREARSDTQDVQQQKNTGLSKSRGFPESMSHTTHITNNDNEYNSLGDTPLCFGHARYWFR